MKGFGEKKVFKKKNKKESNIEIKLIKKAIEFHKNNNLAEAKEIYEKCIKENYNNPIVFSNYGALLRSEGNLEKALYYAHKATELNPNYAEAFSNLGIILKDLGRLIEAKKNTIKALEIKDDYVIAYSNLGIILNSLGEVHSAKNALDKAIFLKPNFAPAYYHYGILYKNIGNLRESNMNLQKAIKLNPKYAEAYIELGIIFEESGNILEAERNYKTAIQINPKITNAFINLGNIKKNIGEYYEAINYYENALITNKKSCIAKASLLNIKKEICYWSDQNTQNKYISNVGLEYEAINPWSCFFYEDNPLKHLQRARKYFRTNYLRKENKITNNNNNKIHVGYFSADFRSHPSMSIMASIFEEHNKSNFKIFLYSFSSKEDNLTERVKNSGVIYKNVKNINDSEIVELVLKDKLDIAVDLMGYTKGHRMSIFSYRVSNIQINFMGFPGSTGADNIDYLICDNVVIPNGFEKYYSEKVIRMKNSYLPYDTKKEIFKGKFYRSDFRLPEKDIVFTCFNQASKISYIEFDIWMEIIKKVKGSVLWLLKSNKYVEENIYKEAEKRNIDRKRIVFTDTLPLNQHLKRHELGDIALDTFNCNGHTTTADALWMGLPVVTKIGKSFASRVSASLLTAFEMPELITKNILEYKDLILKLSQDITYLEEIKLKMLKKKKDSKLFKSELFIKDLEEKFIELKNNFSN